jgi:transglutaminase-like putative cysteine protease
MSTTPSSHAGERTVSIDPDEPIGSAVARPLALGCVLVLTASYVSVLYGVTSVVGGSRSLFALVGLMLVAATVLARLIRPRTAAAVALTAAALGFAYYLESAGLEVTIVFSATDAIVSDTVALVTGLPLIRMVQAGIWTLGFAPAPVFLSWYLALRGEYGHSAVVGGAALGFLVLTGDAGTPVTLAGILAAIGAVAAGEFERRGGSITQAELLAVLFALIVGLSLSVTVVPGEPTGPTHLTQGEPGTLEATIDTAPERSGISGQVDLSPAVRFTVESDHESYWRTGVYDRFTGDEWIRTGQTHRYDGRLSNPPGDHETVTQTVTAETELGVMPVAPQPLTIDGDGARRAAVSRHGQPRPDEPLEEGDSYTVESADVERVPSVLRTAGTDYPDGVADHYLQTPEETSDEFRERTAEIAGDAETPYATAVAIESHLQSSKGYSLEVAKPPGNVAEEFLLEMDEGYCVYFATTMTQMLRAEGIPARYVTGYTTGQRIDDDEYVVRGLDAHAWVEVYFPDHGWVRFDPTPGDSREATQTDRLEQARANGNENADTEESESVPLEDDEDEGLDRRDPRELLDLPDRAEVNETLSDPGNSSEPDSPDDVPDVPDGTDGANQSDERANGTNGTVAEDRTGGDATGEDDPQDAVPVAITRETAALGFALLVGLAAGIRRTDATSRLRRTIGIYWHGRRADPDRDAERAFDRLERVLARRYRPRRRSESARAYLAALSDEPVDPRVERVREYYERAVYGDGIDRAEADEAVAIVDDVARTRLPLLGRRS